MAFAGRDRTGKAAPMCGTRWTVIVALALVGACSSSKPSSPGLSPRAAVTRAVTATQAAGTVEEQVTSVTPTSSGSQSSKAKGSYDFAKREGSFSVDTGDLLGTVAAAISGPTLYIHVPASLAAAAGGKSWVSVDLADPPSVPGVGNLPSLVDGADPALSLHDLVAAMTTATKEGVSSYRANLDLNRAPDAKSASALLGGSTVSADLKVGADGRVQSLTQNVDLGGGRSEVVTTTYSAYGAPVTVKLPSPAQTVDARKLLGG